MLIKHKTNTKHIKNYTNSYLHCKLATKSIFLSVLSFQRTWPFYKVSSINSHYPFQLLSQQHSKLKFWSLKNFKMAKLVSFVFVLSLLAFAPLCFCGRNNGGFGSLYPQYYDHSCPKAKEIVKSIVAKAFAREARIAASILRLHFHDCFVQVNFLFVLFDFVFLSNLWVFMN